MTKEPQKEYIPSWLDDYPLKMPEFRIYCRVSRRQRKDGLGCFESIPSISKTCNMNPKTARAAITFLSAARLIKVSERDGQSKLMQTRHHSEWVPADSVALLRKELTPTKNDRGVKNGTTKNNTPVKNNPSQKSSTPPAGNNRGTPTERVGAPLPKEFDEGYPIRESNLRESKEGGMSTTTPGQLALVNEPENAPPAVHKLSIQIANEIGQYYNSVKPERWSKFRSIMTFSKDKERLFGYLWDASGKNLEAAKQIVKEGMAFAKCDPFYSGVKPGKDGTCLNRPGISFFLEKSRYDIWPEKCPGDPDKIHGCALSDVELQGAKGRVEQAQSKALDPVQQKMKAYGWITA